MQSLGRPNPVATSVATAKRFRPPGGLFRHAKSGRWYWRVQLGGKRQCIPMKPKGAKYATKSKSTAEVVRNAMWKDMVRTYAPMPKTVEYWAGEFKAWNAIRASEQQA